MILHLPRMTRQCFLEAELVTDQRSFDDDIDNLDDFLLNYFLLHFPSPIILSGNLTYQGGFTEPKLNVRAATNLCWHRY